MALVIHRSKHTGNYVILPHYITRDEKLSFCARGLLAYLLSLPSGWHLITDQLAEANPESRQAIRHAMTELRDAGYVQVITERGSDGRTRRHLDVADTKRGTPGVWCDQDKRAFPQVAPTAVIPAVGIPAVKNVSTEPKYGESPPSPTIGVGNGVGDRSSSPTEGLRDRTPQIPPHQSGVSGNVGESPQAVTRARARWESPEAIAARQAEEYRAWRRGNSV